MLNRNSFRSKDLNILCFGDNDWWYHNHGHMDIQLMKRYAQLGKVLYVNSIVVRKVNIHEGTMFLRRLKRKLHSITRGMRPSGVDNLTVYSPFSVPVHHISVARQFNRIAIRLQVQRCMHKLDIREPIVWVVCPGAAEVAVRLPYLKLVYQRSDRYEDLPGVDRRQVELYDQLLKKHADLVIYVNRKLIAQEKTQCRNALFLDHGVDYELFANAHKEQYTPQEMKQIQHPILGFYGGIDDHTSDIPLVEKLADLLSDFSIVLIGNSSVDLSVLASRKNVYLFGQKPYGQIPHYVKCFDVCFMPWRQNSWIEACNPVKLKEYLASGKPIVSTPFSELEHYEGLVRVASDAQSFAEAVRQALREKDPRLVSARRERVRNCTWDAKAELATRALFESNQRSVES